MSSSKGNAGKSSYAIAMSPQRETEMTNDEVSEEKEPATDSEPKFLKPQGASHEESITCLLVLSRALDASHFPM